MKRSILLTIAMLMCGIAFAQNQEDNRDIAYNKLKTEYNQFRKMIAERYPVLISEVKIANMNQDGDLLGEFGDPIASAESMFLIPRVRYKAVAAGTFELCVRIYKPDGTMSGGAANSKTNTYKILLTVGDEESGIADFTGVGGTEKGYWPAGEYRIEIWYEDTCLSYTRFTLS